MDWTKVVGQVINIKAKGITDLLLICVLLLTILGVVSDIFGHHEWVTLLIFCLDALTFMLWVFAFIYFLIKAPEYLRSEQYQIVKQSLEMIGDDRKLLDQNAKDIVSIVSPYSKNLGEENGKKLG